MIVIRLNDNGHLTNFTETDYIHFKNLLSEGFDNLEEDDKLSEDFELHNKDSNENTIDNEYNSLSESDTDLSSDESDDDYHDTRENIEEQLQEDQSPDDINNQSIQPEDKEIYDTNLEENNNLMFEFSD